MFHINYHYYYCNDEFLNDENFVEIYFSFVVAAADIHIDYLFLELN
jgi:hypothetical protein